MASRGFWEVRGTGVLASRDWCCCGQQQRGAGGGLKLPTVCLLMSVPLWQALHEDEVSAILQAWWQMIAPQGTHCIPAKPLKLAMPRPPDPLTLLLGRAHLKGRIQEVLD